ncbi:hypothetical protein [Mastigocoleus sp. MO_188.B34]|uniref:hypothetical protein n=1 Tax=Mastigocoleus sp. MO_188.B34 TaxID=3036635 RepID=UPI002601A617|nr:hypothetical protein [Mastigocoleus sp. MO_188.B34]MDJ0695128.1 hypothetical protein [Mastigocoleus sp. MO_188.B34]
MAKRTLKDWLKREIGINVPIVISILSKQINNSIPASIRLFNNSNLVQKNGTGRPNLYSGFLVPYIRVQANQSMQQMKKSPNFIINKIRGSKIYRKEANLELIKDLLDKGKSVEEIIKEAFGILEKSSFDYFITKIIVDGCQNKAL